MKKSDAIDQLGGSISSAARAIGISYQAVRKWPEDLPRRIEDRVVAAMIRANRDDRPQSQPAEASHA